MAKQRQRMVETPMKRSARYLNPQGALNFDNHEEAVVYSPEEKASYFMSQYNEIVDPFQRFPNYWSSSAVDYNITLNHIKQAYKRYVLGDFSWSEDKFVAVINEMFERDLLFNQFSFDWISKLYEREQLDSQNPRSERRRRDLDRRKRDI